MGCAAATAKRRRKQAANGYRHLAPQQRPRYPRPSKETSEKREARARETRVRMQQKKKR